MKVQIGDLEAELKSIREANEQLAQKEETVEVPVTPIQPVVQEPEADQDPLDEDTRKLEELKKQLEAIQKKGAVVLEVEDDESPVAEPAVDEGHSGQLSVNHFSNAKGLEESSYLPAYVPPPKEEKKKIVKKVRFHDDNAMSSAEKPHRPLRRLEESEN